ncbi:MAG: tRNA uracil 4-sulfurtransferase ThiI [Rectinemataceae bacterium]
MEVFFLIKIGEVLLKLGNRKEFLRRFRDQINHRLSGVPHLLEEYPGRYFLTVDEKDAARAAFVLAHTPGVNGFARAEKCHKTVDAVMAAALRAASGARAAGGHSFKAETRRSDKSFPLGSYEISAKVGELVLEAYPDLHVDLQKPDFTIDIEIRERAYIFAHIEPGPRGLPSGSGGKGLLMLSGGIDSPVAGYMMARRGLALEGAYFHAYPYTSDEARAKVVTLARRIAVWSGGMRLWVLPFTDIQMELKKRVPEQGTTLMMRAAMMQVSDRLARRTGANCIITGESLGQVASQTAENMRVSQSLTDLPVLRPLVGTDKEDTVTMARKIGTFETSILPYEDCCVLFSPRHPVLKADFDEWTSIYRGLELAPLVDACIEQAEEVHIKYEDALEEYGFPRDLAGQ